MKNILLFTKVSKKSHTSMSETDSNALVDQYCTHTDKMTIDQQAICGISGYALRYLFPAIVAITVFVPDYSVANVISYTQSVSLNQGGLENVGGALIPRFDPYLGSLNTALITVSGYITPVVSFNQLGYPLASTVTLKESLIIYIGIESLSSSTPPQSFFGPFVGQQSAVVTGSQYQRFSASGAVFPFNISTYLNPIDATNTFAEQAAGDTSFVSFNGGSDVLPFATLMGGSLEDNSTLFAVVHLSFDYTPVPEPATWTLLLSGLMSLLCIGKRSTFV